MSLNCWRPFKCYECGQNQMTKRIEVTQHNPNSREEGGRLLLWLDCPCGEQSLTMTTEEELYNLLCAFAFDLGARQ